MLVTVGAFSVYVATSEETEPGRFITVTSAVPATEVSVAAIAALSWVLEMNVVVRKIPFQYTLETPLAKWEPLTLSVNAAPNGPDVGDNVVIAGAFSVY